MPAFTETAIGKIVVGLSVAAGGALIGALITWATTRNAPPTVALSPESLEAEALEEVRFTAEGSADPEGDPLAFAWRLNALPFDASPAAQCAATPLPSVVTCRFLMPGTHAVTVEATDGRRLRASRSASVTVILEGGYVGLVLGDSGSRDALERALLYAVDWRTVQANVASPIVLNDPDLPGTVYAASRIPDIERARTAMTRAVPPHVVQIYSFGLPQGARDLIVSGAAEAGLAVSFVILPPGEVATAIGDAKPDGGIVLLDRPSVLAEIRERF